MYSFTDFETVKNLPEVFSVRELSAAIGLSASRTHILIDDISIPYIFIGRKKFIFKEHLIESLSGITEHKPIHLLKSVRYLTNVFNPSELMIALGVSHGNAYTLIKSESFPVVRTRNRIVVSKTGLIEWINKRMNNF